jgi:mono/diheme cytochrome c family protein
VHEHDEVGPAAWKLPAVKSAANCAACHASAEQGDFRKRNIRIPR